MYKNRNVLQIKAKIHRQCKIPSRLFRFQGMRLITLRVGMIWCISLIACSNHPSTANNENELPQVEKTNILVPDSLPIKLKTHFSRDTIVGRLTKKMYKNDLRIIHVLVPLCDNEFQGIVPVNASLGNGQNLRTNLYWGAGYGIKTHFSRSSTWKLQQSILNQDSNILERVIYTHVSQNVVLIADAYRGDRMEACVLDYFNILAGLKSDKILLGDSSVTIGSSTDLVVFNGHNGLMDVMIDTIRNTDGVVKDAVAIACSSHYFFKDHLNASGGYPLVMTANLLAPEAYVLHNVLDAWIANKSSEQIRFSAAQGYHNIQKCGIRGASNLFVTGWNP